MNEEDFVAAVQYAVDASPHNGSKWHVLESLFAEEGLRGNGALNNHGGADRRTRMRQLDAKKKHNGHEDIAVADHSVFVIGGQTVPDYSDDPDTCLGRIKTDLEAEHSGAESLLVFVAEPGIPVKPVHLYRRDGAEFPLGYEGWWTDLSVTVLPPLEATEQPEENAPTFETNVVGDNVIYFGPPGTGKSTKVKLRVGDASSVRTQFHPEYSHSDLVGSYRPVVGHESGDDQNITGHHGEVIPRPVSYFDFVPGPLTEALEVAFGAVGAEEGPRAEVFLVIEEINRGDCAAIFGDIFQLLDRDETGRSEFGVTPRPELVAYLTSKAVNPNVS